MNTHHSESPHATAFPFSQTPFHTGKWIGLLLIPALALALNAFFHPYLSLHHDARLYALQSLNHLLGGQLGNDLYFKFNSQDSFSIFTSALAPFVSLFGLHVAYLLAFLAGKLLLFVALFRFLTSLVGKSWTSILAVLLISVFSISILHDGTLAVNEAFLTPRLYGVALSLLALHSFLKGATFSTFFYLLAALAFHPIMAFPAAAVVFVDLLLKRIGNFWTLLTAALLCAAVFSLLAHFAAPLGLATLSSEWLDAIYLRAPFNLISSWTGTQWFAVIIATTFVLGASLLPFSEDRIQRFYLSILIVTAGGLLTAALAESSSVALLLQAQSYRTLWLLNLVAVPCAILLATSVKPLQSVKSLIYFCVVFGLLLYLLGEISPLAAILDLATLCGFGFYFLRIAPLSDKQPWQVPAVLYSITALSLLNIGRVCYQVATEWNSIILHLGPSKIPFYMVTSLDYHVALLAICTAAYALNRWKPSQLTICAALLTAGLLHTLACIFPYHSNTLPDDKDNVSFASNFLANEHDKQERPNIYWPYHSFELHHTLSSISYFDWQQVAGVIFSEQLARKAIERATLVRPFEISYYNRFKNYHFRFKHTQLIFQNTANEESKPTSATLVKLCMDPDLDYAFLHLKFDEYVAAASNSLYAYRCSSIRSSA